MFKIIGTGHILINLWKWYVFKVVTSFPVFQGLWCGYWSCDCELHSARSSLAQHQLLQPLSHSTQPSHYQMRCYSCSPDENATMLVSTQTRQKPVLMNSVSYLWGSTSFKCSKDDINHSLGCEHIPTYHSSILGWLQDWARRDYNFDWCKTSLDIYKKQLIADWL